MSTHDPRRGPISAPMTRQGGAAAGATAAGGSGWSLHRLLSAMDEGGASDLFVTEGKPPGMRIQGQVVAFDIPATSRQEIHELCSQLLNEPALRRFEAEGDLDIAYSLPDGRRFRFNLHKQQGRVGIVARALPHGSVKLEELGLPEQIARMAEAPRGLVLVTGATGAGKSTTLAAMVHHVNETRQAHIVIIEDPVEFVHSDIHSRVTQREVGTDTATFATALKHVLRESPDVIAIGELRDPETIQLAVQAALTGHTVFATIHTADATQSINRILNAYSSDMRSQGALDLSMCLTGVVSQRLLPKTDGTGRVVACEILKQSPAIRQAIREQRAADLSDLMKASPDPGMLTFNRSMLDKVRAGAVPLEIAQAYASNPDEFALAARGMETGTDAFRTNDDGERSAGLDLRQLLERALSYGASDLHLAVGRPPMYRISGQLRALQSPPLTSADMRVLLHGIMTSKQRTIYEQDHEIDFSLQLDSGQRFRVNAYHQKGHMAAAFRTISSQVPDATTLGLPEAVQHFVQRPTGLVLVVGPTGSGKTTTLACMVDMINRSRPCRIITVEDPIEYTHASVMATVDQREVYSDTKSFAAALKYILRQDPDVILVGEMRDQETIHSALTAAETGHLVMATLHANDALQSIERIVDTFPTHQQSQIRSLLSNSMVGVISQRLLRRKDGKGRVAAYEVMVGTSAIRNLIRENKMFQARSIMETGRKMGMNTLDQDLARLFHGGLVEMEEAARYVENELFLTRKPTTPPSSPQAATQSNGVTGSNKPKPPPTPPGRDTRS